jgi:hypothetical protein
VKEKLVEEWLIRARERGGIDLALAQWLISQGHEILWRGHSRTEFGKDIVSVAPDGEFHAFQTKDEDIDLTELRRIRDQIKELVEVPPVHPRIPHGSVHSPHLVTSGLIKEEVSLQIRAMNERWAKRGWPTLEIVGREGLIPRFVSMSDAFWPERPTDIRDFFTFYLKDGRGDFDPKKFSAVLKGLLPLLDEPTKRKAQRLASVGLLGNYLLHPFERERDHWSLFRGWTMIAAHQAWFAEKTGLPSRQWMPSFSLAKLAAQECLIELCSECLASKGFLPPEIEFDDYTRARNLVLASALAVTELNGEPVKVVGIESAQERVESLLSKKRFFSWGESAVPHLVAIQWYCEKRNLQIDAFPELESVIAEVCERNHPRAEDVVFAPPVLSADDVMADLFGSDPTQPPNRRAPGTWTLQALMEFFARRNRREFLDKWWRKISRLDLLSFQPESTADVLIWECREGHESVRKPEMKQSWSALRNEAMTDRSETLPRILQTDSNFGLMFLLTYPHRLSPALINTLDNACTTRLQ